jgi:hypothetical protein
MYQGQLYFFNFKSNSGNAYYPAVRNTFSSCYLSNNVKIKIYKIVILPVILYGCETWSLTVWEEHRLRVFEKRVLKGPKKGQGTGVQRKLHNGELHNF